MIRAIAALAAAMVLLFGPLLPPDARGFDHGEEAATPAASPSPVAASGTGAAYLTIRNDGDQPDRLIAGETGIARAVEFHRIAAEGDLMRMQPLPEGVEIPAGGEVVFAPGGYHVMLIGLTENLRNGDDFELTLRFERAGDVEVPVDVRPRADQDASGAVTAGDLVVEAAWSRPAPALTAIGTPAATPAT